MAAGGGGGGGGEWQHPAAPAGKRPTAGGLHAKNRTTPHHCHLTGIDSVHVHAISDVRRTNRTQAAGKSMKLVHVLLETRAGNP